MVQLGRNPAAASCIKTDVQAISDCGVMSPLHRIVFARVKTLCHILLRNQTDLLALLFEGRDAPRCWPRSITCDLAWISDLLHSSPGHGSFGWVGSGN